MSLQTDWSSGPESTVADTKSGSNDRVFTLVEFMVVLGILGKHLAMPEAWVQCDAASSDTA
ncbi:MAG: hypothetical protein N2111_03375 [Candidatus Sumerlaeaceae bacterium]|nr:hypothetical protein [Candidatus Sumerlaeaceae bacterium]